MPFVDLARNKSQNDSPNSSTNNMSSPGNGMQQTAPSSTPTQVNPSVGASPLNTDNTNAQSQPVNPPTKDPVSIEDGLVDEAVQSPEMSENIQKSKMEDGSTVISKPQADELGQAPVADSMNNESEKEDDSSTPYPTLESMKQDVSLDSNTLSSETTSNVSQESVPEVQVQQPQEVKASQPDNGTTLANMGPKPAASNSPLVLDDSQEPTVTAKDSNVESIGTAPSPVEKPMPNSNPESVSSSATPTPSTGEQQTDVEPTDTSASDFGDLPPLRMEDDKPEQSVIEKTTPVTKIEENVLDPDSASLKEYINYCLSKEASDIHFAVNYPVHLRVDGRLEKVGQKVMTEENAERLLLPILSEEQRTKLQEEEIEADFMHVDEDKNRFRVNIFKEKGDLTGAFRWIPKRVRTIDELNLPPILKEFSKIPYGLVLLTGPTGSGKTTTIAAMIEEINKTEPRHIITIEDPVEYVFDQKVALIAQRNMTQDTASWKNALRSVLRQDPDVVLIGEMRDYETIASALTIAETGHLVFATLHTNTAAQSIDRIIDVFPEGQQNQVRSQLSMMLSGVISQRLIPLGNGGRKAAMEILIGTPAVKNAIREAKTHQIDNIIQTSADVGMVSLEKSLVEMVRNGDIDVETAKDFTIKPDEIDLLLR